MTKIRTAIESDAKKLAEFARRSFEESFFSENTPEDMEIYCREAFGENIQRKEILNPTYNTILAEDNNQIIAYAQLRWGNCPSCVIASKPGEIQRIYVDKSWHGKGVANELMSASLKIMQEHNTDTVWLGVWEKNPRAISFYKKFNFVKVGEHEFTLGNDVQRDVVMALSIS